MGWKHQVLSTLFLTLSAITLSAQTFRTLASFQGTNGSQPNRVLLQGLDGNFYGVTASGGNGYGTVYKVTPEGALTTIYTFNDTDGANPYALIQTASGDWFGTASQGGQGFGTIFRISSRGAFTTLHVFHSDDGAEPDFLIQGNNGALYGATFQGGSGNACFMGGGTIFTLSPSGTFTTLYNFDSQQGCWPGSLIQTPNGDFYGTAGAGGDTHACNYGCGTVFELASGTVTTLHTFDLTDGETPQGPLLPGADGVFYGTTAGGGLSGAGTVFQVSSAGTMNTVDNFNSAQGSCSGLIEATDGNFYGVSSQGGTYGDGAIFKLTPAGALTILYSFNMSGGAGPWSALVQGTDGNLYGTTYGGGTQGDGTIFRFSVGLDPFVKILPHVGQPGTAVTILGTNLGSVTQVTFNGTAAPFTIISPTEITTTVPPGALTGKIQVVTSGDPLLSDLPFAVRQ
jgi:uncharacterized repeat protein (TIGR03803 family)